WRAGSRAPLRREVDAVVHPHWKAQAAGQPAVQEGGAHVAASEVPSSGAISLLACVPRKGRRTALLLDSDPRMVRYLRANLEARGFRPVIATSAPEALLLIELEEPDLVLLDVAGARGEVDGLVARTAELTGAPILLLTQRYDADECARLLDLGAADYIGKPLHVDELF